MKAKCRFSGLVCLAMAMLWGATAQAQGQYLLTENSGGELQIGTGLPLPIGPAGIFEGGKTLGDARNFPDLLVPPAANALLSPANTLGGAAIINQTGLTPQGGAIQMPPSVLSKAAPGTPERIAVFPANPAVFQVATSISYAFPAASATFAPGGGPGSTTLSTAGGGQAFYGGGAKAFGGAAQFSLAAGPGASGGRVPTNGLGVDPIASVWINFTAMGPASVMAVALVGASNQQGLGQPGAPIGSPPATTMFGGLASSTAFGAVNVPGTTAFNVGPAGTIDASVPISVTIPVTVTTPGGTVMVTLMNLSNMVTASKGFPWTTGTITLSQGAASPPEIFYLAGSDNRGTGTVIGEGNIQLVSGALSLRALSGPNGNRGWLSLTLPEPTAALGTVAALSMLGLCHARVRRRSA